MYNLSGFVTELWSALKGSVAEQHPQKCLGLCFCSPMEITRKPVYQASRGLGASLEMKPQGAHEGVRIGSIPPPQPGNRAARAAPPMGVGMSLPILELL